MSIKQATEHTSTPRQLPGWQQKVRRYLGAGAYPFLSRWIDPQRKYSQPVYAQTLSQLFREGADWLDAGCGHQVFKLASALKETEIISRARLVVGCDLGWEALRNHRSLNNTVCADLRRLPFAPDSFDVVTLNYVAEHLDQPERTFCELARLLRPQGILVVVTPHSLGYFVRLTRLGRKLLPESLVRKFILLREFRSSEDVFPTFYRANRRDELIQHAAKAGLTEIHFQLLKDPAMFNFIAPIAAIELLFGRLLSLLRLKNFESGTLIGIYQRTVVRQNTGMEHHSEMTGMALHAQGARS